MMDSSVDAPVAVEASRSSVGRRSGRSGAHGAQGASRRSAASSSVASEAEIEDVAPGDDEWDEDGEAATGGARLGPPVQRRERKNVRERMRRAEVNDAFDDLTTLLRVHRKNRADKTSVLVAACVEIRALRRRLAMFEPLDAESGLYPNGSSVSDMFRPSLPPPAAQPSLSALAADMDTFAQSFSRGEAHQTAARPAPAAQRGAPPGVPAGVYQQHTLLPIDETSDSDAGMHHARHAAAAAAASMYASQFQLGHAMGPWQGGMPGYMPPVDATHMSTLAHQMQHMQLPAPPARVGVDGMAIPEGAYGDLSTGPEAFAALQAWTGHQ